MSMTSVPLAEPSTVSGLPHAAQSWIVDHRQSLLPRAAAQPAIVVYYRPDHRPLDASVLSSVRASIPRLVETVSSTPPRSASAALGGVVVSRNNEVAVVTLAVSAAPSSNAVANRVLALRRSLAHLHPRGVETAVTGGPAFTADLGQVFNGADTTLLLATIIVAAALLVLTYRSPVLWLIPLLVIGPADQVAAMIAGHLAPHLGIRLDGSSTGIAEVLVFGAGTDYALLLIARYRDELHHEVDRFRAMRRALGRTAESVLASATTVTVSLALMLSASVTSVRALGFASGIGIVVAALFTLFVLPAALVVAGRGAFWPLVPRVGDRRDAGRVFARVGAGVGTRTGLSTTQRFTARPESVVGHEILASAFPAGSSEPVIVVAPTGSIDRTETIVRAVPGVVGVSRGPASATWAELDLTTDAAPSSPASYTLIDGLRHRLAATVPRAAVGGDSATNLDLAHYLNRDALRLALLILLVVVVVLLVLLRSLVAPLLLLGTVLSSYVAAMGIAWFIFRHNLGYPALDTGTAFYAFLFLVALGVDYNIFLTARPKEEAERAGPSAEMLAVLRSTGGVITSAGVLLASVFLVLGVLPLITLTQVGVIVCTGVLLDTLLVRTILVPALALALGRWFWWPHRSAEVHEGEAVP
ncbi:MAG: hypothetical protein B7Z69_02445 [Actinobacteria bacterium 21-73-9]|nr:MAG: hypothetical protein B7Z69_02445 [Actinobacteria bacterium 21-73-9]